MGLSDDQKALLRLLAGGQGYEDIAALLGTGVDEVRAKAAAAVSQLEAEGIPAPTLPGAATAPPSDPEPPSDPPPPPAPAPVPPAPEPPLKPAPVDPGPPSDPPPPAAVKPPPAAGGDGGGGRPKLALPSDPGRRAALAAGAIVVALVVVIIIVSGSGGSDSSSPAASGTTSAESTETGGSGEAQNTAGGGTHKATKAVLEPVGEDRHAAGVAIFGRIKKSLALQVEATGLQPTDKGEAYTVWLAQSPQKMLPLASTTVKKDGRIAAQFEVPVEVLAYLASETFDRIVVTRTDEAKLRAALKEATKEEKAPSYTGEAVLSGEITGPIIGAQKRVEESKKEEKK